MSESIVNYDALEVSFTRPNAAPIVMPKPKFGIDDRLKDSDGDYIQIIGLEWCLTDVSREPYWKYTIWDIALGCVLDMPEFLLEGDYTKS